MRALLSASVLIALLAAAAAAQEAGRFGVGAMVGQPLAVTGKYLIDKRQAVDFGAGVAQSPTVHADYVLHAWGLLPQPRRGPLAATFALGPRLEFRDKLDFGFRTMLGLSYWPKFKRSAEFFIELGPTFRPIPSPTRVRVDGAVGVRMFFAR